MLGTSLQEVSTPKQTVVQSQFVVIKSDPSEADVYIDDKSYGLTPFTQRFEIGEHTYRISKDLYYTEAGKINIDPNVGTVTLNQVLKPNFGSLEIRTKPESEAMIWLDGKPMDQLTPISIPKVKSGVHTVRVGKKLYNNKEQKVTINDNELTVVELLMDANFGVLSINSTPEDGAAITLDGETSGMEKLVLKVQWLVWVFQQTSILISLLL